MNKLMRHEKGHFVLYSSLKGLSAGVTGRETNNVDYDGSYSDIRSAEKRILSGITGLAAGKIVMLEQVHGNRLIHVINYPSSDLPAAGEADGLITPIKGIALVIRTADCVPVVLYDQKNSVLGAVHAGWKGAMLDIPGRCINEMAYIYGSDPQKINAFILPSIGPESYEVNEDVAVHFPGSRIEREGKLYVDLWGAVENLLKKAGLKDQNIFNARICNRANHAEFFSHRFGDKGRNLNFAFMK